MIRINLLPVRAAQKKEKLRSQLTVLILCLALVAAACGGLYVRQNGAIEAIKQDIASLDKQNNDLRKQLREVANFDQMKQDLQKKLDVLASLKAGKSGPVRLLDELNRTLPDKVWLTDFSEQGGNVSLNGFGDSEKTVASFMKRLEESPYYRNVELAITEQADVGGMKMQKFSLRCQTETPPSI